MLFEVSSATIQAGIKLELFEENGNKDYRYIATGPRNVLVGHRSAVLTLEEFFSADSPVICFVDGSSLEGNVYTRLKVSTLRMIRRKSKSGIGPE